MQTRTKIPNGPLGIPNGPLGSPRRTPQRRWRVKNAVGGIPRRRWEDLDAPPRRRWGMPRSCSTALRMTPTASTDPLNGVGADEASTRRRRGNPPTPLSGSADAVGVILNAVEQRQSIPQTALGESPNAVEPLPTPSRCIKWRAGPTRGAQAAPTHPMHFSYPGDMPPSQCCSKFNALLGCWSCVPNILCRNATGRENG